MDVARSPRVPRDPGAAFRNRVWAFAMVAAALPVTAVSLLIGIAPYDVEDTRGSFVPCGRTLFHTSPSTSPLCEADIDPWRVIAEAGLVIAAGMVLAAIVFGIRSAWQQELQPSARPRAGPHPTLPMTATRARPDRESAQGEGRSGTTEELMR